jgi:hypothetical protein
MTSFSVSGTATRLVRETIAFTADVQAASFSGVEAAVRTALTNGDYEVDDTENTETVGSTTLTELGNVENCGEVYVAPPAPVYTRTPTPAPAATGYAAAGRGQGGFAVANVETRPNGYVPVRVAHRAAR